MPGLDPQAGFAQVTEPLGGSALLLEVVAEGGKAVIIEDAGEVRDVGADDDFADPDRLVAGGVAVEAACSSASSDPSAVAGGRR